MNISITGLGLIGGSLAKAFKYYTENRVIGSDIDEKVLDMAVGVGAIDEKAKEVPDADVYFLAMSPVNTVMYLEKNAHAMKKGAIVTDVCGIKALITEKCNKVCMENGLRFVGGHPMAGREVSGFENSVHDLFVNRSYIFTKIRQTDIKAVETLENLVLKIGVNHITITDPKNHDRMIAFTSQLPHILAGAYMKSPTSKEHNGFSAGSYHDVSRVSSVDENLWSELFLDNKEYLEKELEILESNIRKYRVALQSNDREALLNLIKESRILKENDRKHNGKEAPHKFG